MFNSNVPSVADIAAVMGNNGMNGGFGWGGDGWWGDVVYRSKVDANVFTPAQFADNWELAE